MVKLVVHVAQSGFAFLELVGELGGWAGVGLGGLAERREPALGDGKIGGAVVEELLLEVEREAGGVNGGVGLDLLLVLHLHALERVLGDADGLVGFGGARIGVDGGVFDLMHAR